MWENFLSPDAASIFWLMLLHCLIGLTAGIVADSKGHFFLLWFLIGLIGGTIALIISIRLPVKWSENKA